MERFFSWVERVGNRLPHPFWLFVYICLGTVGLSMLAGAVGWKAVNPKTGETIIAVSLFSRDAMVSMVLKMVENFAHFAPLGLVVVMLMGVAVAEKSGLLEAVMKLVVSRVPGWLVVPVIVILGACGNIGSDAGIVIVPPLAAVIFRNMGLHPLAGLVLGYASATAGFTANLVPAGTDVLLAAITTEAMQTVSPGGEVVATCNIYFMIASVFMLALIFTYVARRFTLRRFASYEGGGTQEGIVLSPLQKKGILWATIVGFIYVVLALLTVIPQNGLLRHPDPKLFMQSPFFKGLIPVLFFFFILVGWIYGKVVGTIKTKTDVVTSMVDGVRSLAPYIVLVFMIAQFIKLFQWSYMDQILAIKGAEFLNATGFTGAPLFVSFVVLTLFVNLFLGSGSAKWALMAPVFVPMFHHIGVSPAAAQLVYRIGDSVTNGISPLYVMFPLVLGWINEYDKKAGMGTVFGLLLPYAIFSAVAWSAMLVVWYWVGLPIGIGEGF